MLSKNHEKFKYLFFLTKEMYIKLKLTNYNVMIKIGKQDLIDIIDIKNTRLSHTFYQQKFCKM